MAIELEVLSTKLEVGKQLNDQIETLKDNSGFMTHDEIRKEERILDFEEDPEKEIQVQAAKKRLESNPDYLDENQIQALQSKLNSINVLLSNDDGYTNNMNRVGILGLECVKCRLVPCQVFSCCQDHLICPVCLPEVDLCPICKQCFKLAIPRRNHLAERLIAEMKTSGTVNQCFKGNHDHCICFFVCLCYQYVPQIKLKLLAIKEKHGC